ncbi:MAG: aminoacyl-tRNA hydrolase [Acidobacteria bacterium]|nr:aminoacyl-tRNA hydrolase [Acidobacteriota bacterium]
MSASKTWLIAGLGNPGPEYAITPHNLGFLTVDRLAARHAIRVTRTEDAALVGLGGIKGSPAVLAKPQTFMNSSGVSVRALCGRYDLGPDNLLLIYDELALPWGNLRVRPKGSAAGHNGVKSVIACLQSQDFARIRIGIHPGYPVDGARYVLTPVRKAQWKEMDELVDQAADAAESVIAEGVEKAMTAYNRRAQGGDQEER